MLASISEFSVLMGDTWRGYGRTEVDPLIQPEVKEVSRENKSQADAGKTNWEREGGKASQEVEITCAEAVGTKGAWILWEPESSSTWVR